MKLTRFLIGLTAMLGMGWALFWLALSQPGWAPMVVLLIAVGMLGQLLLDVDRKRRDRADARQRWDSVRTSRQLP
ncbi:hypothetical protein [Falsiroseomonas sp. HW251]|uniref:hypothetical protein n=1 Tax=Falsiroseomonas sp. HW251 TaxID=3390998 RepID=UPI003D31476B